MRVASRARITDVNGSGRRALAEAVKRHRGQRYPSREAMAQAVAELTDPPQTLSPTTVKNVETKTDAVSAKTLRLLDVALGWDSGTAQAILLGASDAPEAMTSGAPSRRRVSLTPRLVAELEGREVLDVKAIDVSGTDARVVLTLVGDAGMDTAAIRAALLELDEWERRLRSED